MTQVVNSSYSTQQAEVARLREELQMRVELVQQLSRELFRLVKGNAGVTPTTTESSEQQQAEVRALREQLQGVEQQVTFYQGQLEDRKDETVQLRQTVQELTDRTRMLEQVVQELPKVYRQKFEGRMDTVRGKVKDLQTENRRLQAELQSVSYRLAVRTRRSQQLDLPSFAGDAVSLPGFTG
ncbi:MAG: Npun_F5560 family protein [Cyanobacteria bacterium P01_D01_bin.115]